MSRYLGIKRTWVLLGLVIAAGFLLSACDEETRSRPAIFEEQSRVEGEATSSIDATPAEASTPTPLPTITLPPTSTPTPTRPRTPTPTRAQATPTPTSVPVSTPETDAEKEVVSTPTPVPGDPAENSSSVGSATSTAADLGEDSDTATSTIVLAEPARPIPQPIHQIALSGVRMTTNRPGQVQFVFSLRDENGLTLDIPAKDVRSATKIYELFVAPESEDDAADAEGGGAGGAGEGDAGTGGPEDITGALETIVAGPVSEDGAPVEGEPESGEVWAEVDYAETSIFVRTADLFQQEVVFVLDFSSSMAGSRLRDGTAGTQAMIEAFFKAMAGLPETQKIGVVEFHDRNEEPAVLAALTIDREEIRTNVSAFASSQFDAGSSRVWDSIERAAFLFTPTEDNPSVVKSVVFITDGRDTSSTLSLGEVQTGAILDGIQLYAVGVGEVFDEPTLVDLVRSTGGAYHPVPEQDRLQNELELLVQDLKKQFQVSYTSLRGQGTYRVRLEVGLSNRLWRFDSELLSAKSFAGSDSQGRIVTDAPVVDLEAASAEVSVRALHVPRNVARFRFRIFTPANVEPSLVAAERGGLIEDWSVSGPDADGYYDLSSSQSLTFGNFGRLFDLLLSGVTENTFEIGVEFDNSIYPASKSFSYPATVTLIEKVEEAPPGPSVPESIYRRWGRRD